MKYLIPVFVFSFLFFPIIAQAQILGFINPCTGLEPYATRLCLLLWNIQRILYAAAIALAVIMVIIGGITYMTAGGDEEKARKARKIITNGVIGFAIVIAFSFILGLVREIVANALLP